MTTRRYCAITNKQTRNDHDLQGAEGLIVAMFKYAMQEAQSTGKGQQADRQDAIDWLYSDSAEYWLSMLNSVFGSDYTMKDLHNTLEGEQT